MSRDLHFKWLNNYRHSREYAEYARTIGTLAPGVDAAADLPSLIGVRWQIDERIYNEFLEMLPPMGSTANTFYMSEFCFSNITTKYTREGDRYFCEFARWPSRKGA